MPQEKETSKECIMTPLRYQRTTVAKSVYFVNVCFLRELSLYLNANNPTYTPKLDFRRIRAGLLNSALHSNGIPRLINAICTDCLVDAVTRQQHPIDATTVARVIAER